MVDSLFAPARKAAPKKDPEGVESLFAPVKRTQTRQDSRATNASKGAGPEVLSRRYSDTHALASADKIDDGFCDLVAEKVLVDRACDHNFAMFLQRAQRKLERASDPVTSLTVLALLVSEFCGFSGVNAAGLEARFKERLRDGQRSDGKILLGSLMADAPKNKSKQNQVQGCALARHRALAFKAATDMLDLRQGTHACTLERDPSRLLAWNMVQLHNVSYVVDLMHDPGALYEATTAKHEEYIRLLAPGLFDTQTMTISTRKELQGDVPRPPWHIEAGDLEMARDNKSKLGKGGFGEVFRATWSGINVAVKAVLSKELTDYDVLNFILEIALLARLNHPNVMRLWRGCVQVEDGKQNILMVTEFIEKGDLSVMLHGRGGPGLKEALTLPQVVWLSLGIARGMQYLHACKVLHLDLKSPNVLIDESWNPKLCDFGLAKISNKIGENFQTTVRGVSPIWAPPEMFDDQAEAMTEKADVYSFGIVLFEIACKQLPFQEIQQRNLPKAKWEGVLPEIPSQVPEQCATLINFCCAHRPGFRPSMSGVVDRISEIASTREIDLANVTMPAWKDAQDPADEQGALKVLNAKQAELQRERERLAAKLEQAKKQRVHIEQCHLNGQGFVEPTAAEMDELFNMPAEETEALSPMNLGLLRR